MQRECKREGRVTEEEDEAETNVIESKTQAGSGPDNTDQDPKHRLRKERCHPGLGTADCSNSGEFSYSR